MNNYQVLDKSEALAKILREFMLMWLLTGAGMFLGSLLPPIVSLFMSILALVLLIATIFMKSKKVNKIFYAVPFLLGFAFFFSVSFYLEALGAGLVLGILLLTIVMFVGLGFLGYVAIKTNLGGWGKFLLFALLILIGVGIIGIFFPSYMLQLLLALAGIIIFSLYTVYDFNQIQHNDISADETTGYALSLYLDFLNLFLKLLQLAYAILGDD